MWKDLDCKRLFEVGEVGRADCWHHGCGGGEAPLPDPRRGGDPPPRHLEDQCRNSRPPHRKVAGDGGSVRTADRIISINDGKIESDRLLRM